MIHSGYIKHHNEIRKIHEAKDADYSSDLPLSNFKEFGDDKAFFTAVIRMSDKFSRIKNFVKNKELKIKDETVIDTLHDLANYALIAIVLFEEQNETQKETNQTGAEHKET